MGLHPRGALARPSLSPPAGRPVCVRRSVGLRACLSPFLSACLCVSVCRPAGHACLPACLWLPVCLSCLPVSFSLPACLSACLPDCLPLSARPRPFVCVPAFIGINKADGSLCGGGRSASSTGACHACLPASACLRLPLPASACLRLPLPASACLRLPPPASACLCPPLPASACLCLPLPASACLCLPESLLGRGSVCRLSLMAAGAPRRPGHRGTDNHGQSRTITGSHGQPRAKSP